MLNTFRKSHIVQTRIRPTFGVTKRFKSPSSSPSVSKPTFFNAVSFTDKNFLTLPTPKLDSLVQKIFPTFSLKNENINFDMSDNISSSLADKETMALFLKLLPTMQTLYLMMITMLFKMIENLKEKMKLARLNYFQNTLDISFINMMHFNDNEHKQSKETTISTDIHKLQQKQTHVFYSLIENKMKVMNIQTFKTIQYLFNKKSILNLMLNYLIELFPLIMLDKINLNEKQNFIESLSKENKLKMFKLLFDNQFINLLDKRKKENMYIQSSIREKLPSLSMISKPSSSPLKSSLRKINYSIHGGRVKFNKRKKTNKKKRIQKGGMLTSNFGTFLSVILLLIFCAYMYTINEVSHHKDTTQFYKRQISTLDLINSVSNKFCENFSTQQECSFQKLTNLTFSKLNNIENIIDIEQTNLDKFLVLINPLNHVLSNQYNMFKSKHSKHKVPILIPQNTNQLTYEICETLNSHIQNVSQKNELFLFQKRMPFMRQVLNTMNTDYINIKSFLKESKLDLKQKKRNFLTNKLKSYKKTNQNNNQDIDSLENKFVDEFFHIYNFVLPEEEKDNFIPTVDDYLLYATTLLKKENDLTQEQIHKKELVGKFLFNTEKISTMPNYITFDNLFDLFDSLFDEIMRIEFIYDKKKNSCKVLNKSQYVERFSKLINILNKNILFFSDFVYNEYSTSVLSEQKQIAIELFKSMHDRAKYLNMIIEGQSKQDQLIIKEFSKNLNFEKQEGSETKPYFEILEKLDKTIYSNFFDNLMNPENLDDFTKLNAGEEITKRLLIEVESWHQHHQFTTLEQIPESYKSLTSNFFKSDLILKNLKTKEEEVKEQRKMIEPDLKVVPHIRFHNAYTVYRNKKFNDSKLYQSFLPTSFANIFSKDFLVDCWNFSKKYLLSKIGVSLDFLSQIEHDVSATIALVYQIIEYVPLALQGGMMLLNGLFFIVQWAFAVVSYILAFPLLSLFLSFVFYMSKNIVYYFVYWSYVIAKYPISEGTRMAFDKLSDADATLIGSKMIWNEINAWWNNCKNSESWLGNIVNELKKNKIQNILNCNPIIYYLDIQQNYKNLVKERLSFDMKEKSYFDFRLFIVDFIKATNGDYRITYDRPEFQKNYPHESTKFPNTFAEYMKYNNEENYSYVNEKNPKMKDQILKKILKQLLLIWIRNLLKDICPHLNILLLTKEIKNKKKTFLSVFQKEEENEIVLPQKKEINSQYIYMWQMFFGKYNKSFDDKSIEISENGNTVQFIDTLPLILDTTNESRDQENTGIVSFFFPPNKTKFEFSLVCEKEKYNIKK